MEQKINIAELLKDCPKGMELDCLVYGVVKIKDIGKELFLQLYVNGT